MHTLSREAFVCRKLLESNYILHFFINNHIILFTHSYIRRWAAVSYNSLHSEICLLSNRTFRNSTSPETGARKDYPLYLFHHQHKDVHRKMLNCNSNLSDWSHANQPSYELVSGHTYQTLENLFLL